MRQPERPDASTSKSTPAASNSSGETSRRLKPAQLASMARYRERNQSTLREKARERMARRRARLAHDAEDQAMYREKARAADARYREGKAERLSTRQVDRRALTYIQKYGADSWLGREERRKKIADALKRAAPTCSTPS
ncbi:hypothetical protein R3P38DRAFT_2797482 [Favolaschia claudopus]|uniref:Uncharacterized protein n=1 Tax=Favolaschia claudopus TaxID=2862362 RepID=A0AAW0A2K2_9AGAR